MKRYRTSWGLDITQIEIIRETEHQAVLPKDKWGKERRENKISDWGRIHETRIAALHFLVRRAEEKLAMAKTKADNCEIHLLKAHTLLEEEKNK